MVSNDLKLPEGQLRYDMIEDFNVDSKAEYSALSSTHSQKKKLKQTAVWLLACCTRFLVWIWDL